MSLNALAAEFHSKNVERGWYSDPTTGERINRNVPEMLALMHSEVSEFYEAAGLDDKLPQFPNRDIELADLYIRTLDTAGYLKADLDSFYQPEAYFDMPSQRALQAARLHGAISKVLEEVRKGRDPSRHLADLIHGIHLTAKGVGFNLDAAVAAKDAYNATRADHQLANRRAAGGKRF